MRHYKKKVTLDRKTGPRQALLRQLAESLILFEKIKTTKAKAAATRSLVERLITMAKTNTLAARRLLIARLAGKNVVKKLLEVIAPRYQTRPGGYTRTTNLSFRKGDGAAEALIEFV